MRKQKRGMEGQTGKKCWWKRLLLTAAVLGLLCLAGVLAVAGINFYMIESGKNQILTEEEAADFGADCILVLGAGVWNDSTPSPMLQDRLDKGLELYGSGVSDRLLMSGDHGREEYDEVNVMKEYVVKRGVPSFAVFMDHAGFSTYESMYRAKEIFGVEKVVIVTQEYHMYRALYIARKLGLDAVGVVTEPITYGGQAMRDMREAAARVKDFVTVLAKPLPTYLGETIPITGNGDLTNDQK